MPRLLRVHFSSIGHPDARLAPVTLDFRSEMNRDEPAGSDSVIWLRNGGGKSSMLNLLFSVFLPNMREFLGTTAEGKKQRFEDYLQAEDLGFVITEWDLSEIEGKSLFTDMDLPTRIVGRMVAWPNQHKSADVSSLKHLFFSLKTSDSVTVESLPVQGLAEPARGFEAFRRWLFDLRETKPNLEVYYTDVQRDWHTHLENIHLDPELFRYLVHMNRNEGDAESLFRHRTAKDFVRFFLRVALDPSHADRVVGNLDQLKKQLRLRPRRILERDFLQAVLKQFEPFAIEAAQHREAKIQLDRLAHQGGALMAALAQSAEALGTEAELEAALATKAAEKVRSLEQREHQLHRWTAWLRHRALQFDLEEAEAEKTRADRDRFLAEARVRVVECARYLQQVRELQAEERALVETQRISQQGREPLRHELELAGSRLIRVLEATRKRVHAQFEVADSDLQAAKEEMGRQQSAADQWRAEFAQLGERVENLKQQFAARDQALARLVKDGIIRQEEIPGDAGQRWGVARDDATKAISAAEQGQARATQIIEALQDEKSALENELAQLQNEQAGRRLELHRAAVRRDRLACHPRILEVEEVHRANLEAAGLLARLDGSLRSVDRELFQLRLAGAETERALDSIQRTQLLPPSRDVEAVLTDLQGRGIPAHSFQAYLAQNVSVEDGERLLASSPGRFTGVGVPTPNWLDKVRAISGEIRGLRTPVQISTLTLTEPAEQSDSVVVIPDERGGFSVEAARDSQQRLEEAEVERKKRQEMQEMRAREIRDVTRDVREFLNCFGDGKLADLESIIEAAEHRIAGLQQDFEATQQKVQKARNERQGFSVSLEPLRSRSETVTLNHQIVEQFCCEHESKLPQITSALRAAEHRRREIMDQEQNAAASLQNLEVAMERQRAQAFRLHREVEVLDQESSEVRYRSAATLQEASISMEEARAEYRELEQKWERDIGNDRLQGKLEQIQKDLTKARQEHSASAAGVGPKDVEACCDAGGLDDAAAQAKHGLSASHEAFGAAKAAYEQARRELDLSKSRAQPRESPPGILDAEGADEARHLADEYEEKAANVSREATAEQQNQRRHHESASHLEGIARGRRLQQQTLEVLTRGTPAAEPAVLPEDDEELERILSSYRDVFGKSQQDEQTRSEQLRRRLEAIRQVAEDDRYATHQDQIKIRLRSDGKALTDQAEPLLSRLQDRCQVVLQNLKDLDKDRDNVLAAVHDLAMEAKRLLESVEKVSVMPEGLDAWTGQPFLRVRLLGIGKTPEERKTRLEPVIDRIIEDAELPDGVQLAALAVEALLGGRDFDVTLLKPQVVRRLTRHPITDLACFSEGEKLTVAVLLFCTLVRLRARNRPQASNRGSASVLILDNPFGKCNFPEFIRMQLTLARQLNVQLIYTTAVDDLGALAHFPNRIRLRNTSRHRVTQHSHVTLDEEAAVTGIRLAKRNTS